GRRRRRRGAAARGRTGGLGAAGDPRPRARAADRVAARATPRRAGADSSSAERSESQHPHPAVMLQSPPSHQLFGGKMRRILPALLCLGVVLAGCRAKEAIDKATVAQDLEKRGTTDLIKEIANDKYDAPQDGHLTDGQNQMYLKVREHEKVIAQVAKAEAQKHADAAKAAGDKSLGGMIEGFKTIGAAAEMFTANLRAAKDLHYNTAEYQWVKGQILAASMAEFSSKA